MEALLGVDQGGESHNFELVVRDAQHTDDDDDERVVSLAQTPSVPEVRCDASARPRAGALAILAGAAE